LVIYFAQQVHLLFNCLCYYHYVKVKVSINLLYRTQARQSRIRGTQVHGAHQAASHIPALNLTSRSWYSFTDRERMEG